MCVRVDGARVVATLHWALVVLVLVRTRNSGRRIDAERKKAYGSELVAVAKVIIHRPASCF
jgi:hypothetical protein